MSADHLFGPERKPWDTPADDRLMPSSYEAVAVFAVVQMTVRYLHDHDYEINASSVGAWSKRFAGILIRAQIQLGQGGWKSSLNTRLRGALHTALEVIDLDPTDQDTPEESMRAWVSDLEAMVVSIARTADWLYHLPARELAGA